MNILVVEDDKVFRGLLEEYLSMKNMKVTSAETGKKAINLLSEKHFDVVLLDLLLPDINGIEILKKIKEKNPETEVVVITGHGTIKTAVEAMKLGAHDFLTKPCMLEEIEITLNKALEHKKLRRENELLKRERKLMEEEYVFESPKIKEILKKIEKISCAECPVLITGESGTGKEVIARLIHKLSDRAQKPFVALNAASIPRDIFEAELFGYEKGAFTGATSSKEGFFELANGGTLFLDEIGELSLEVQAKLLRVIENRKFYRLGGRREIEVDVRILVATNRNLKELVKEGKFREDLYYRLGVIEIEIPPLRERREDIIPLANHFLKLFNRKYGKNVRGFSKKAQEVLLNYPWYGNVRELRNVVERAVLFAEKDLIDVEELSCLVNSEEVCKNRKSIKEIEKEQIIKVLKEVNFNKRKASEILDIPLRTLYRRLKEYGIE